MLLEKHWTSPKAVPIAFPVNFFTTGWQKGLELFFFFLRSAYSKFVNISIEPFIKLSWGFISPWLYEL